jgi:signal transduction histidine kinase
MTVMRPLRWLMLAVALLVSGPAAFAQDKPTPDLVRQLTLEAAQLVEQQGVKKVRDQFHAQGRFRYGEVYVNVIDYNGNWLVYPPVPKNEGKSVLNARDADGKLLVQDIIRTALDKDEGWVSYRWLNPATNTIQPKDTFVKNVPSQKVVVYIGLYR